MVSVCNPFSVTTSLLAVKALRGTETVPNLYPAEILWPAPYASTPLLLLLPDRTWLPRTTAAAGKYPRVFVCLCDAAFEVLYFIDFRDSRVPHPFHLKTRRVPVTLPLKTSGARIRPCVV